MSSKKQQEKVGKAKEAAISAAITAAAEVATVCDNIKKAAKPVKGSQKAAKPAGKPECEGCQHTSYCDKAHDPAAVCGIIKRAEKRAKEAAREAKREAEEAALSHEAGTMDALAQGKQIGTDGPVVSIAKASKKPNLKIHTPEPAPAQETDINPAANPDKGVSRAASIGLISANPTLFFSQYKESKNGVTIQPHSSPKAIVFPSWPDVLVFVRKTINDARLSRVCELARAKKAA